MRTQSTVIDSAHDIARKNPNDLVAVYSMKGDCAWASPSVEAVLGYSQEEMVGRNWSGLVAPEDHYNAGQVGIDAFLNGASLEFRIQAMTKAGEVLPMRVTVRIQLDPGKKNQYLFFLAQARR